MKKIKILTLNFSNNYGAVLQNYALSRKLRDLGFEVETVRLRRQRPTNLSYLLHPIASIQKIMGLGMGLRKLSNRQTSLRVEPNPKIFETFRETYIGETSSELDYELLSKLDDKPFAYVVGSDVVWAADVFFQRPSYLLGFEQDPNVRKIAYAASFGKGRLENYQRRIFRENLKSFHAIGVREVSGTRIICDLDQRLQPKRVLDPTLLISDYSEIISHKKVPDCDYILVYRLNQEDELARASLSLVEAYARKQRLKVINISPESKLELRIDHTTILPSPGEFLGLIEKAKYFFTNSFHGVVFAQKFNVNFICFARDQFSDKKNLRMQELMNDAGLLERFFEAQELNNFEKLQKLLNNRNDLHNSSALLSPLIEGSADFLHTSLQA